MIFKRSIVKIDGKPMYLWRAVGGEGEVLDVLVQKHRNKRAALKILRKLLQNQGIPPTKIVTYKLRSYSAALRELQSITMIEWGLVTHAA